MLTVEIVESTRNHTNSDYILQIFTKQFSELTSPCFDQFTTWLTVSWFVCKLSGYCLIMYCSTCHSWNRLMGNSVDQLRHPRSDAYSAEQVLLLLIIIITTTIFIVLSSTAPAICESSLWFLWAKVGQRQVAANSQAKLQTWPLSLPV